MKTSSELATLAFLVAKISGCYHLAKVPTTFINMAAPLKVATDYDLNEVMLMNMTGNLPRTDKSYRLVVSLIFMSCFLAA